MAYTIIVHPRPRQADSRPLHIPTVYSLENNRSYSFLPGAFNGLTGTPGPIVVLRVMARMY